MRQGGNVGDSSQTLKDFDLNVVGALLQGGQGRQNVSEFELFLVTLQILDSGIHSKKVFYYLIIKTPLKDTWIYKSQILLRVRNQELIEAGNDGTKKNLR